VHDALISAFNYDSSVVQDDMASCLRSVWQIPRTDQDRLVAAMQSPKLQRWIMQTTSSALFLNFNAHRNQRSISFIAAKLAESVPASSSAIVLSFFCGLHSRPIPDSDNSDFGVAGMMRSLISQLLVAYQDFSIQVVKGIQAADLDEVKDLCKMLFLLVAKLPRKTTVFCILDGVTRFEENKALREESEMVVKQMVEVVDWTAANGCCFKLLLTSPGRSQVLYRHLIEPERDSVWLPANVPSQGGFTKGKWEAALRGSKDRLGVFL